MIRQFSRSAAKDICKEPIKIRAMSDGLFVFIWFAVFVGSIGIIMWANNVSKKEAIKLIKKRVIKLLKKKKVDAAEINLIMDDIEEAAEVLYYAIIDYKEMRLSGVDERTASNTIKKQYWVPVLKKYTTFNDFRDMFDEAYSRGAVAKQKREEYSKYKERKDISDQKKLLRDINDNIRTNKSTLNYRSNRRNYIRY